MHILYVHTTLCVPYRFVPMKPVRITAQHTSALYKMIKHDCKKKLDFHVKMKSKALKTAVNSL